MSNPALEKLNTLSPRNSLILGFVIMGLYYFMMYDDGSGLENKIKAAKSSMKKAKSDLQNLAQAEEDAKKFRTLKAEMGDNLSEIIKYVPEELNDFDLMGMLSTEAKAAGANISNVTALSATSQPGKIYEEVAISVELESTYTQLLLFLSFISRSDKIIAMREGSMDRSAARTDGGEVLLKFRGIFVGYRYKNLDREG